MDGRRRVFAFYCACAGAAAAYALLQPDRAPDGVRPTETRDTAPAALDDDRERTTVRLRVEDAASGAPIPGARIRVIGSGSKPVASVSDAFGAVAFNLLLIRGAVIELRAVHPVYRPLHVLLRGDRLESLVGERLALARTDDDVAVTVRCARPARLRWRSSPMDRGVIVMPSARDAGDLILNPGEHRIGAFPPRTAVALAWLPEGEAVERRREVRIESRDAVFAGGRRRAAAAAHDLDGDDTGDSLPRDPRRPARAFRDPTVGRAFLGYWPLTPLRDETTIWLSRESQRR